MGMVVGSLLRMHLNGARIGGETGLQVSACCCPTAGWQGSGVSCMLHYSVGKDSQQFALALHANLLLAPCPCVQLCRKRALELPQPAIWTRMWVVLRRGEPQMTRKPSWWVGWAGFYHAPAGRAQPGTAWSGAVALLAHSLGWLLIHSHLRSKQCVTPSPTPQTLAGSRGVTAQLVAARLAATPGRRRNSGGGPAGDEVGAAGRVGSQMLRWRVDRLNRGWWLVRCTLLSCVYFPCEREFVFPCQQDDGSMDLEQRQLRDGEYVAVRRFTRILERGPDAKATVDEVGMAGSFRPDQVRSCMAGSRRWGVPS